MTDEILLTGATGFIGSHVLERLLEDQHRVVVLKRSTSSMRRVERFRGRHASFDLDRESLESMFERHDIRCILHLATDYGSSDQALLDCLDANLRLPVRLLAIGLEAGLDTFVHADTFLPRHYPFRQPYALTKKQCVDWMQQLSDPLRCVNLKLEHPYGESDAESKFVPFIARELLRPADGIDLTGGEQLRDLVHVSDVAEAMSTIVSRRHELPPSFVEFDVGTGTPVSIREIVETMKRLARNGGTELRFGVLPYREGEIMESHANPSGLREQLGWQPRVSLEEGLQRTLDWQREHAGSERSS